MTNTITLYYSQFLAVLRRHPELVRYKRYLTGSCCRIPEDEMLKRKIAGFVVEHPVYRDALADLLPATPA